MMYGKAQGVSAYAAALAAAGWRGRPRSLEGLERAARRRGGEAALGAWRAHVQALGAGQHPPPSLYEAMYAQPWLGVGLSALWWGATHMDALRRARRVLGASGLALELGCGGGALACALALQHPGWQVVGVDQSEAAVASARWLARSLGLGARARFVCADASDEVALADAAGGPVSARVSVGGWLPALGRLERDLWDARAQPSLSLAQTPAPPAQVSARLRLRARDAARTASPGAVWLLCERVGTTPGARALLGALTEGGWRVCWRRSGFARGGADDGGAALPLWVLEAAKPSAAGEHTDAEIGAHTDAERDAARLLRHWASKHPARAAWSAEPALHAEAERRALSLPARWGVTLRFEAGLWLRLRVSGAPGGGCAAYIARGDGARWLYTAQPLAQLRSVCASIQQSFDVVSVLDPASGYEVPPRSEEGAYALGLALLEARFEAVADLEAASAAALG